MRSYLAALDTVGMAQAIRDGAISPVEAVRAALERIETLDPTIGAFALRFDEEAKAAARAAERTCQQGEPLGPLHGVPVSVKEVMWVRGAPAANGSVALRDFVPSEDAALVERLNSAGAIIVGKTNNPEFCYAGHTENDLYGVTRNPWDPTRTPGGSSGGAAASVACGMTPTAIGSDGGGSIRIPASFCGVAGFKPTFGVIPQGPGFDNWKTLTVNGPIARSVRDLALTVDVLAGPHPSDNLSLPPAAGGFLEHLDEADVRSFRIAFSEDLGYAPVEPAVRTAFRKALDLLREDGWKLEEARPQTYEPTRLWSVIALCEGYASDSRFLTEWESQLRPSTVATIEAGAAYSAADYVTASYERARYSRVWAEFFCEFDALLTPTVQLTAFPTGVERPMQIAGRALDPILENWCEFIYPANLTWQPALSVPCGFDDGQLPIGLQIMAGRFEDLKVLQVAAAWEELAPWGHKWPQLINSSGMEL